jgi:hypothetical protein
LREAYRVLGQREVPLFAELAYSGAVSPETSAVMFARWSGRGS